MKDLRTLPGGKPAKAKQPKPEKSGKRSLFAVLGDWVLGLVLDAVRQRWENKVWEPGK